MVSGLAESVLVVSPEFQAKDTPPVAVSTAFCPSQMRLRPLILAFGSGFIPILKVTGAPTQLLICGVTVMEAVWASNTEGAVVLIFPVPFAGSPTAVLLLVQAKVAEGVPLKTNCRGAPAQMAFSPGLSTEGADTMAKLNVCMGPGQAPVGVRVMVAVCGTLVAVKAMLPEPLAAKPTAGLLFVQVMLLELPVMGMFTV